jgi:hypothetical protein
VAALIGQKIEAEVQERAIRGATELTVVARTRAVNPTRVEIRPLAEVDAQLAKAIGSPAAEQVFKLLESIPQAQPILGLWKPFIVS